MRPLLVTFLGESPVDGHTIIKSVWIVIVGLGSQKLELLDAK